MDEDTPVEDLPASQLGTKEYWDELYERELTNYNDFGDEGEIWFGKACERRVLQWINTNIPKDAKILDLGCGNGHFTLKLWEQGFLNLGALDYSVNAVELTNKLLTDFKASPLAFVGDIMNPAASIPECEHRKYDLVVDKGTFDAMSLNPDIFGFKTNTLADAVKSCLAFLFRPDSAFKRFVITSCNWTSDELKTIFAPELQPVAEVAHASFVFGNRVGHDVSTVIFEWQ